MTTAVRPRFQPNVVGLGLLRARLELRQFFRGRESVIFSFAFPIMLLLIFASIFHQQIAPGVKFTQYFIAGMIAAAQLTNGFQTLAIQIPESLRKHFGNRPIYNVKAVICRVESFEGEQAHRIGARFLGEDR